MKKFIELPAMKSAPNSISTEKREYHAQILSNRIRNRYAHFSKKFRKQHIDCFRLYDWDIKEVRAVVDWYAGHIVVGEYVRWQTGPDWLPRMAKAVAETLGVPPENIHMRERRTNVKEGTRYSKIGSKNKRFTVKERDLLFWVNLDDYLDTGLFSDHRDTRALIRKLASGKSFLNLFAYTGAFTCAAAAGGAKKTVTVDRSDTYIDWAQDNLKLNKLWSPAHTLVKSDTGTFLSRCARSKAQFDLILVDPPSFFQDRESSKSMDINLDHPQLIRDCLKLLTPGGELFFSTNHQRFEPCLVGLPVKGLKEITAATIPEDYRNKTVHRCWRMQVS